jgi:sphingosine kinase
MSLSGAFQQFVSLELLIMQTLILKEASNVDSAAIPYYDIVYAEYSTADIVNPTISITYLVRVSSKPHSDAKVKSRTFAATKANPVETSAFVKSLLAKAYGESQLRKRIKVFINPFGGQGWAQSLFSTAIEPILRAAQCELDVIVTERQGHAEEIASELDINAWDVVACCSGDGIPHEVFNGLAKQAEPRKALSKIAVVQLPCGSGNAMCWNLCGTDSPALAALAVVKGLRTPLDLVSVTQQDTTGNVVRKLSFLSQALGIVAECDLATEHLRWLGDTRFTVGYLIRLMRQTLWPADIAVGVVIDNKKDIKAAYHKYKTDPKPLVETAAHVGDKLPDLQFGTVADDLPESWKLTPYENLGNFYAGNMAIMTEDSNVFPTALPADGCMDLLMVDGDIRRLRAAEMAMLVGNGQLIDAADAKYLKVVGYRIIPHQKEGYISIDGERFPFSAFQAEAHPALGCVLSKSGTMYEAKGPDIESA